MIDIILFSVSALILLFLVLHGSKLKQSPPPLIDRIGQSAMRGICAIEIMIGHIGIATLDPGLFPFRKAGILPVGYFFLLSGYGLMSSLSKNENYLNRSFIPKRLTSIWIPVCTLYALRILIDAAVLLFSSGGIQINAQSVWQTVLGLFSVNWYVWEISALYLVFFILFRYFQKNRAIIILSSLSVIFVVAAFFMDIANPWYGSTLCFPLGILLKHYEKAFTGLLNNKYFRNIVVAALVLSVSIASFFILGDKSFIGNVIGRNAASLSFCILVTLVLFRVELRSSLTGHLGRVSYEIFLIHPLFIGLLHSRIESSILLYVTVIALTVALAFALQPLNRRIKSILQKS